MQVARWGNSLAVRIPVAVTRALSLVEGDEVEITARDGRLELSRVEREKIIAEIRATAKPLPADWKFDREEANGQGYRF